MLSCGLIWILIGFSWNVNGFFFPIWPEMKPEPDHIVQVNHNVTISCTIKVKENISLYLNKQLLVTSVAEIKYPFESQRPGVYKFVCKYREVENSRTITFRYAPRVTSATALITGLDYCHMTVEFGLDHFDKDYIAIYRYDDGIKSFKSCSNGTRSCSFQCQNLLKYTFQVKLSAPSLGVFTFNRTISASFEFYKLDEMNVTISSKSSESLNLTYGSNNNNRNEQLIKKQFHNCLYRISYKSQWNQTEKILTTDKTEIQLENLVPYTTYTIDVQARLNQSIYWSDKVTLTEITLPSAPYAGPDSTNGSYSEIMCAKKSKRCFIFYWAGIPMPLRNGIFDSFVIQQNNKTLLETSEIYGQINDQPKNKDLWFEIRARNNNSKLSPPTIIHIPPEAPKGIKVVSVVMLNNSHVEISWALNQSSQKNVNVTVMSCLGEKIGSSSWCKSHVLWTPKIQKENFTIIKTESMTDFLAAVYVSNSEGSSSLTFAECVLSRGIASKPPMPIIKANPHQLNFLWPKFSCKDLNGRPTLFQVLYAEGNNCSNGLKMNIPASVTRPETEDIRIKNLKPFTKYSVCLRIHTEQGWSSLSPQKSISTNETNPSSGVRNLTVVDVTSSSVTLRWDPSVKPNGIITNQFVYYATTKQPMYVNSSNMATVSDLDYLTQYNFQVSTCNKGGCSKKSKPVSAKTLYDKQLVSIIVISVILFGILIFTCIFCMKRVKKNYGETKIDLEYPDVKNEYKCRELPMPPNIRDKMPVLSISNWPKTDDKNTSVGHIFNGYSTIDLHSQSELICSENGDSSSTEDKQHLIRFAIDNKNNNNSTGALKVDALNELSTNLPGKEPPTKVHGKGPPTNHCLNNDDYIRQEHFEMTNLSPNVNIHQMKSSEMSHGNSDSNDNYDGYITKSESSQNRLDSKCYEQCDTVIKSQKTTSDSNHFLSKLNQASQDSNGYIQNDMSSPGSSQANSNGYVSDDMSSSEMSQANSESKGYVSNDTNSNSNGCVSNKISSESSQANSNSNGYLLNDMESSASSQANSNSNGYLLNDMESSVSSQANSNSNGCVSNKISSESSQANSNSNGYLLNDMESSASSQANSNSNGYLLNDMESSASSQANSNSNGYLLNDMESSASSQANSNSNGCVSNKISSESSQANSNSNGYLLNDMESSASSQANSNSNGCVSNKISSESSQANSNSNGCVSNKISSASSQANSNSNGCVSNKISSESSQANSNSNGCVSNKISSESSQANSNSNGCVSNKISSESSQANSNSNGYLLNDMESSASSQANSNSNGYLLNDMESSVSSQANSNSNGYVSNNISSESSQANSNSNEYVSDNMSSSKFTPSMMDSNGYVQNMNPFEVNQTNTNSNSHGENHIASRFSQANSDHNVHIIT